MSPSTHRLTKTQFVAGLQCERRLWLLANRPEERRVPTLSEQRRMRIGTEFGRNALQLFPGGVEIEADRGQTELALEETSRQLQGPARALFEAAFLHHQVLVRVDILKRSEANPDAWEMIEVKSASDSANSESSRRRKLEQYISDMGVQLHVLEGAGIPIDSIALAWANSNYERMGDLDWRELVAIEDFSGAVRNRACEIGREVDHFLALATLRRPVRGPGHFGVIDERMGDLDWRELVAIEDFSGAVRNRACEIGREVDHFLALVDHSEMPGATYGATKCGKCEFDQFCWGDEPEDSIIHLPGISARKLAELGELGVRRIREIPEDFDLTSSQALVRQACDHPDGMLVDREALAQWIEELAYPLHFLDFESWAPCIPPFDRTRPYMQIPFQYSLHIQRAPGADPEHREFLANPDGDPRPALIERLLDDLGPVGSIVVHHAAFESGIIRELADFSPAHAYALNAALGRIVDTEVPFKKYWYLHPGLNGRSSIKAVLPVLVPELGYGGMNIADGMTASIRYEELCEGRAVGDAADAVCRDLIEYCWLDTLAMVRIVERLRDRVA